MSFQEDIASDVQKPSVGEIVELYELDLTGAGGSGILYFTKNIEDDNSTPIEFNSQSYVPVDLESDGWEIKGQGELPRPTFKISNAVFSLATHVIGLEDLVGAKLTRRRTFKKYLDGEPGANPSAEFPQDIYVIYQKLSHNKYFIEFQLAAYMDFEGVKLPKRQILRDTCMHIYRYWTGAAFNYDNATCPYVTEYCYDKNGDYEASGADDICGKRLKDCELRHYGVIAKTAEGGGATVYKQDAQPGSPSIGDYWLDTNSGPPNIWYVYKSTGWETFKPEQLPTRAFPGVARTRVTQR